MNFEGWIGGGVAAAATAVFMVNWKMTTLKTVAAVLVGAVAIAATVAMLYLVGLAVFAITSAPKANEVVLDPVFTCFVGILGLAVPAATLAVCWGVGVTIIKEVSVWRRGGRYEKIRLR